MSPGCWRTISTALTAFAVFATALLSEPAQARPGARPPPRPAARALPPPASHQIGRHASLPSLDIATPFGPSRFNPANRDFERRLRNGSLLSGSNDRSSYLLEALSRKSLGTLDVVVPYGRFGEMTFVRPGEGTLLTFGTGGSRLDGETIALQLRENLKLLAIEPHSHQDHAGGTQALLENVPEHVRWLVVQRRPCPAEYRDVLGMFRLSREEQQSPRPSSKQTPPHPVDSETFAVSYGRQLIEDWAHRAVPIESLAAAITLLLPNTTCRVSSCAEADLLKIRFRSGSDSRSATLLRPRSTRTADGIDARAPSPNGSTYLLRYDGPVLSHLQLSDVTSDTLATLLSSKHREVRTFFSEADVLQWPHHSWVPVGNEVLAVLDLLGRVQPCVVLINGRHPRQPLSNLTRIENISRKVLPEVEVIRLEGPYSLFRLLGSVEVSPPTSAPSLTRC